MKERPILMSAPMVRALLDCSKTQTRRVCKPAANLSEVVGIEDPREIGQRPLEVPGSGWFGDAEGEVDPFFCPYGKPGDRLWVRETFVIEDERDPQSSVVYRATDAGSVYSMGQQLPWRPSIFMPRWASRISLEITGVRVERLQYISVADALAEGIKITVDTTGKPMVRIGGKCPPVQYIKDNSLAVAEYASLWDTINGQGSWAANPWVWVVEFKRVP